VDVDAHLFQFGEWRSERGELPVRRFHYRKHRIVLGGCAVNVVAPAFELARQFIREAVNRIEAAESVKSAGAQVDEAKEGARIIYYWATSHNQIFMLFAYAKNER
jgi:hypothetical protein